MPNHLADIYASDADIAILGGIAPLVLVGIYLVLRRIVITVRKHPLKSDADLNEGVSGLPGEASWDWQRPVDPATGRASFPQVAVLSGTADLNVRPQDANCRQFGVRIEHFEVNSKDYGRPSVAQTNASATDIPQPGRLATSIREIADDVHRQVAGSFAALSGPVLWTLSRVPTQIVLAERGKRIYGAAWGQSHHKARKVAQLANPAQRGLKATAQTGRSSLDSNPTNPTASPPRVRRPIGLALRLGVIAAICLAVPLGYAMTRQNWIEGAPAISQAQGHADPELSRSFQLPARAALDMHRPAQANGRTSVELLNSDLRAARAQVGAARAQTTAARELAGREHRAAEGERARSAALQEALLKSSKRIDALRAAMAVADNAREERLRNELAAARTVDALRRFAGRARTLLRETANYVFAEIPAAHLERQRAEWLARDLSRARAQIEQLEAETAKDRAKAEASQAQASELLDNERRKSEDLRGDLAEVKLSNAALVQRANVAEQERTGAVTARERVEQTAAETERALTRERTATASIREELKKARLERDAAEQERARAVSARERAEQTAAETAQALARERAAAVLIHEDLDRARLERDAARARVVEVANLKEALDKQRGAAASLARDLAAARAENDRLRTERPSAQVEPPLKPRSGRAAAATGQVKAVSQKTARSKVRNPPRMTRVRSITLPYSLWPRHATME
ncbi:hypothetical protein NKJ26_24370 [Mesorhizobium sp. M0152]|uniref:hypothetical protein n=1 Tax=Mesorhizobium sp. M0152 TaxID=2956898 RepID=UPI003337BA77